MQHWQHRQRCAYPGKHVLSAAAPSSSILDPFTAVTMQQQISDTATSRQYGSLGPAQLQPLAVYMVPMPAAATTALSTTDTSGAEDGMASTTDLATAAAAATANLAAAAQVRSRPGTPRYGVPNSTRSEAAAVAAAPEPDCSSAEEWSRWKQAAGFLLQGAHGHCCSVLCAVLFVICCSCNNREMLPLDEGERVGLLPCIAQCEFRSV
jgi:hypothetical protein